MSGIYHKFNHVQVTEILHQMIINHIPLIFAYQSHNITRNFTQVNSYYINHKQNGGTFLNEVPRIVLRLNQFTAIGRSISNTQHFKDKTKDIQILEDI